MDGKRQSGTGGAGKIRTGLKTMHVEIKLYGHLKKYAPGNRNQFTLPVDPETTLGHIIRMLSMPNDGHVALINGRRSERDAMLADGDVVVFMPLISGG